MPYNLASIRKLLLECFDDEELVTFCQDYFSDAVAHLGSGMSTEVKARQLVGYCDRREEIGRLLTNIQKARPQKFARYAAELGIVDTGSEHGAVNTVDVYSQYEAGLNELLHRLDRQDARYADALVYQQRLYDNLAQSRRYGETETRKAERAEVIDQINRLSLSVLGVSFNELCRLT